jgi:hypothetical protein
MKSDFAPSGEGPVDDPPAMGSAGTEPSSIEQQRKFYAAARAPI